eukprot:CAMPEP_0183786288 /NCGR_PEP_ID=MMETSP0739-20130205/66948_1 /TAXON_ID=385413 /ORGANISM="Thalassiosira miniscula, Strain CCMP1093" /LENGTH=74 /DNA_ID=CAMNT_0026030329 /DNA_START=727 /DNA_END=952 /DNA_ORIENTATION=+
MATVVAVGAAAAAIVLFGGSGRGGGNCAVVVAGTGAVAVGDGQSIMEGGGRWRYEDEGGGMEEDGLAQEGAAAA